MEGTTFFVSIAAMIVLQIIFAVLYITGGRGMDYIQFLKNIFEMMEIVLVSIFTITYLMGSIVLFISTICLREMGHTDSHHTVDISMFGYKYTLTTKE